MTDDNALQRTDEEYARWNEFQRRRRDAMAGMKAGGIPADKLDEAMAEWDRGAAGTGNSFDERITELEKACGLPAVGPLTLEQRVQVLEMSWAELRDRALSVIEAMEVHAKALLDLHAETDTPAT